MIVTLMSQSNIISGKATCIVEGRRYSLSDGATAMQPRGRVHYFINDERGPMEMLWVYAGPRPDRIVVAESCATVEGDPWK
jgi:mannose-6-phosphate isomerase-like protein (cupin superfamily)